MSTPDIREIRQLDRLIPTTPGTVTFEAESILNYQPDGEILTIREATLDWGYPGRVVRVKRMITITNSEYEEVETLQESLSPEGMVTM